MVSSIRTARRTGFAYTPPDSVYGVVRVLVAARTIKPEIMAAVLRGFWRFTPMTRVLVVKNAVLVPTMMNDNMREVDLDVLPMRPYESRLSDDVRKVTASTLLAEVDACIALNTLDVGGSTSPSLGVLRELTTTNVDATSAYFSIGELFAGSLVDAGEQIVWGDDLIGVDEAAYRAAGEQPAPELTQLRTLKG